MPFDRIAVANLSQRQKNGVDRINLTEDPSQVGIVPAHGEDRYQVTFMPEDICSDNYAAFSEFPQATEVSFSGIRMCPHDRRRPPGALLPRFDQGQLACMSCQYAVVYLSLCGLCDECVEDMGLRKLRSVHTLSLAQNNLTVFPLLVAESLDRLMEFDISSNHDLCLEKTEALLRDMEGHDLPVMRQLRVFKASFCPLKGTGMVFYRLIPPSVERIEFSHCLLPNVPERFAEIIADSTQLRHADFQNNKINRLPQNISLHSPSVARCCFFDNNRFRYSGEVTTETETTAIPIEETAGCRGGLDPERNLGGLLEMGQPGNVVGVQEGMIPDLHAANECAVPVACRGGHARDSHQPCADACPMHVHDIRHFQAAMGASPLERVLNLIRPERHYDEEEQICSVGQSTPPVEVSSDGDGRTRGEASPCNSCPRQLALKRKLLSLWSTMLGTRAVTTSIPSPLAMSHEDNSSTASCPFLTGEFDPESRDYLSEVFTSTPGIAHHRQYLSFLNYLLRVHHLARLTHRPANGAADSTELFEDDPDPFEVFNSCRCPFLNSSV